VLRGPTPRIGTTKNPCGALLDTPFGAFLDLFPGQDGPANGLRTVTNSSRIAQINDGSPDADAVAAFNTLLGKNATVPNKRGILSYWESIGSQITVSVDGVTSPRIVVQPYPTYYEFRNGKLVNTYLEAPTPSDNFWTNPYPSGTQPCVKYDYIYGFNRVTPGGRCGDMASPKDVSARTPNYVQP
jgi:hypothetical protein